ncbi:hypothetical protein DT076_16820 [Desertihabitans brevis]|uniref:Uncharacterized protein n=1 Tax=Desertihabitans brevis TaxID=2268447 RepID=A0A367YRY1_9ACTN|nr:hypothetical protein [Desertihabitans brevis]RCK68309.1 hypothetical protein DT076_16820 [Desertihabitans brevis]
MIPALSMDAVRYLKTLHARDLARSCDRHTHHETTTFLDAMEREARESSSDLVLAYSEVRDAVPEDLEVDYWDGDEQ